MGDRRRASRKRAVGTREHIIAYLADNTELFDQGGMASTRLAAAVGYPGSSVAFAQLLSGMERDGLINREVRGKRTYRIALSALAAARRGGEPPLRTEGDGLPDFSGAVNYDELADRVIVRLVRRLAELSPSELAVLERLLVPEDKGSLKMV
ncbi:MAG TPA: hypothetical protein VJ371_15485 [Streptosporangiaceae bacterium]|nr:hypothetical protein [Streptosporangiaceae bacterium]